MPDSKSIVQQALDLVNRYDKSASKGGSLSASRQSKGEAHHDGRVKNMEKKLLTSRQRVVKHLRISRTLEQNILQSELIEQAVKTQLVNKVDKDATSKIATRIKSTHRRRGSSATQSFLDDKTLRFIEDICGIELGEAGDVQNTLNRYDDSQLCNELDMVPKSKLLKMNQSFFSKVVHIASDAKVSLVEANLLYDKMEKDFYLNDNNDHREGHQQKWHILVQSLRKQILITEVANSLLNRPPVLPYNSSLSTISSSSSLVPMKQVPTTIRMNEFEEASENLEGKIDLESSVSSWDNASLTKSIQSISPMGKGKFKYGKLSSYNESSSPVKISSSTNYSALRSKFDKSQSKQLELSDQIISNLSKISQSVGFDESYGSAKEFAQRISVRKLEGVFLIVVGKAIKNAFKKWYSIVQQHHAQFRVIACLKSFGSFKLLYFLEKSFSNKLVRGMQKLKQRVEWYQEMEQISSLVEIQRYWRGSLCRKRISNQYHYLAAKQIQSCVRGYLGRKYVIAHRDNQHLRGCVIKIERAYLKYRWKRIRKNIRVFKFQKKMACSIQRVFRGHIARKRVLKIHNLTLFLQSATKIQTCWRRYKAIIFIEKKRRQKIRFVNSRKIQCLIRGIFSRQQTSKLMEIYRNARTIQCLVRQFISRLKRNGLFVTRCILNIQRIVRGRFGRKRYSYFKRRHLNLVKLQNDAYIALSPIILGHITRKKWIPIIKTYIDRRKIAAVLIQVHIRKFIASRSVSQMRQERNDIELQKRLAHEAEMKRQEKIRESATVIQRIHRGFIGRQKALLRQEEIEKQLRKSRIPAYYRIRAEYYKSQNIFHRPYLIIIQCAYRCMKARMALMNKRRSKATSFIEIQWKKYQNIKEAKKYAELLREINKQKKSAAVQIQRIVRGFMGRYEFKKHEHAEIFKWFIGEVHSLGLIGRALQNFRVRKRTQEKIYKQMVKAQALVRRFLTRCKFLRGYKRLVRERDARKKKRRVRACTIIQGFARIIKAQKVVFKRIAVIQEEERIKHEMEDLDNRIDGIHADWTNDLLAIRVETQVRGMLGKNQAEKKETEVKNDLIKKKSNTETMAAMSIQAMARGVACREKLKTIIPTLKIEKQKRSFCVECESNVAVKRCRNCKDRYCDTCYALIHRKGARRHHSWEHIAVDIRSVAPSKMDSSTVNSKTSRFKGKQQSKQLSTEKNQTKESDSKKDWQKFYDNAAKAHYWYNQKTGEAKWTEP